MCGRYSLVCIDDLGNRYRVYNPMLGARSRFNVAPGNEMPVIVCDNGQARIATMRWGLVAAPGVINARAESLADKPLFRTLLASGRCLVPASGFFEWKNEGKRKVPLYFRLPGEPIFSFAGLFDRRPGPDGTVSCGYTIVTCPPNSLVAGAHDRMPAILAREDEERWLSGEGPGASLTTLLRPYPAEAMERFPVSGLVNSPSVDDERVIRPLTGLDGI